MDTDRVSAAMGQYMLQGWAMLNDGCPDCNTPLMRNREATSQICVNCEMNPPVDPEEEEAEMASTPHQPQTGVEPSAATETETEPAQPAQPLPPPLMAPLSAPAPTSALPSVPANAAPLGTGGLRPVSHQNHRVSVLDPMMEARRALRPVGARNIGTTAPAPPLTPPPPRASTPLPPPPTVTKPVSGPLGSKMAIPLPPGPPPSALPLSPPPTGTLGPQPVPRDMRRSPQSSIIISGNILPPSTPPPAPPAPAPPASPAPPANPLPTPPAQQSPPLSSGAAAQPEPISNDVLQEPEAAQVPEDPEHSTESEPAMEEAVAIEEETLTEQPESATEEQQEENAEETQESTLEPAHENMEETQQQNQVAGDDEKMAESDDDFEDAEEEVFKPTEEELKERESRREQSERASRLIGQKMLQGWAMLQDPCPNPACHGVPLLANREKKEYCVVCENYFQREKNLEHGKYTVVNKEAEAASTPTTTESNTTPFTTAAILPPPVTALPPPPQAASPPIAPKRRSTLSSPITKVASPMASPSMGRSHRELLGRVSGSIVLPPAASMSPSLGMTSQQILGKHLSDDLDKLASEDEEARKHIQIIRKVGEFSNKSLPPVPGSPVPAPPQGSRPASIYSSSSEYHPSEGERHETRPLRHYHSQRLGHVHNPPSPAVSSGPQSENSAPAPPPAPLSAEVQALVTATHKTIATILVKLEAYRQALEVSESPKECQVLTNQIKGLMECLKACRETL
ncbi:hypothetical protein BGZ72_002528 [Mortierella alpina]|nr:hypothetical protein BGZ72_002528 [Mortierella alpina]